VSYNIRTVVQLSRNGQIVARLGADERFPGAIGYGAERFGLTSLLMVNNIDSERKWPVSTDQLVEDLFDLWRWLRNMSNSVRENEVTPQQSWLLHQLRRRGKLTIGEVAEALGVSQSSATTACKRLEVSGWITKARSVDDERVVEVSLTEAGAIKVENWRRRRRQAVADLLEPLRSEERDELQRLVERVLAIAETSNNAHALEAFNGARS
jgi:DNA-binding MarR family transcriptional regulator